MKTPKLGMTFLILTQLQAIALAAESDRSDISPRSVVCVPMGNDGHGHGSTPIGEGEGIWASNSNITTVIAQQNEQCLLMQNGANSQQVIVNQ
jgi:hypothetical protein